MSDSIIRVAIAEDADLIRDALVALLDLHADIEVVRSFERGDDAENWLMVYDADVAILDNRMPGRDGIDVAARLHAARRSVAVIIVSGEARPAELRRALDIPVLGFCSKGVRGADLAVAVRSVHEGRRYLDADLAADALSEHENPLRDKEIDVLRLVGEGLSTDCVAARLHLSPGTVRNYLSSARSKLDAANKIDALRKARREGWI